MCYCALFFFFFGFFFVCGFRERVVYALFAAEVALSNDRLSAVCEGFDYAAGGQRNHYYVDVQLFWGMCVCFTTQGVGIGHPHPVFR